jgi:hypothetical protein
MLLGYIGNPPEDFVDYLVGTAAFTHTDGTPRDIELRATTAGQVTVWLDGVQLSFNNGIGTNPYTVDAGLASSTLHGFALDGHLVFPYTTLPTMKGIERIEVEALDADSPAPRSLVTGKFDTAGGTVSGTTVFDNGTGRVVIGPDSGGVASVGMYLADADTAAGAALGSAFGVPLIGLGVGGSTAADAFIARSAAGVVRSGILSADGVFAGGHRRTINAQTGTAYTVANADRSQTITRNNASASTQTWPQDSAAANLAVGTEIFTLNRGAGTITHQSGTGATVLGTTSQPQNVHSVAVKIAADTWFISTSPVTSVNGSTGAVTGLLTSGAAASVASLTSAGAVSGTTGTFTGALTTAGTAVATQSDLGGILVSSTTDTAVNNTSALSDLVTLTIPAATVAIGDTVSFYAFGDMLLNSGAPTLTWTLTIGGVVVMTSLANTISIGTARRMWSTRVDLQTVASLSAQDVVWEMNWTGGRSGVTQASSFSAGNAGWNTATANLANATNIVLSATMSVANASNEVTCKGGRLELVRA